MKLSEYIKLLQELEPTHGDLEVAFTQEGYYAEGKFADLYEEPEAKSFLIKNLVKETVKKDFLVLGHSSQHY